MNDTILKIKKTKSEIKKELGDSIANGKRNENTDIQQMVKNRTANKEDVAKVIQEFEEIIRNKKSDILWLAHHQRKIFQKFRSKERFVNDMVLKFKVNKSTIVFKIALSRLIDDYPKIRLFVIAPLFLKNLKLIKKVCKENASESK